VLRAATGKLRTLRALGRAAVASENADATVNADATAMAGPAPAKPAGACQPATSRPLSPSESPRSSDGYGREPAGTAAAATGRGDPEQRGLTRAARALAVRLAARVARALLAAAWDELAGAIRGEVRRSRGGGAAGADANSEPGLARAESVCVEPAPVADIVPDSGLGAVGQGGTGEEGGRAGAAGDNNAGWVEVV
jgi:hypothetical protein